MNGGNEAVLILLLVVTLPLAATTAGADDVIFSASVKVDFGEDIGQDFGTLFEVRDSSGRVIIGAGFPSAFNTCARLDRYNLQFYLRPTTNGEPRMELLPRSSRVAHQSLQDCDGNLYAWTYHSDKTLRRWDAAEKEWREHPALDKNGSNFGDGFMRVANGLLVYQMGQAWYEGKAILPQAADGEYRSFYHARGCLFFYHSKSGEQGFTRIWACPWKPGQANAEMGKATFQTTKYVGETPFVWSQLDGEVITVSNNGGIYVFDGKQWRVARDADKTVSYQVYSAVNYDGALLLGQYPTGNLMRYDGRQITQLKGWPPVMHGVASSAREARSAMTYRGELYVGVWPWAELWRLDRDTQQWVLVGRMFSEPPATHRFQHPYEEDILAYNKATNTKIVHNLWGQRVCSLAPWHDSLMIATSAKGPMERDLGLPFLTDKVYDQYGRI